MPFAFSLVCLRGSIAPQPAPAMGNQTGGGSYLRSPIYSLFGYRNGFIFLCVSSASGIDHASGGHSVHESLIHSCWDFVLHRLFGFSYENNFREIGQSFVTSTQVFITEYILLSHFNFNILTVFFFAFRKISIVKNKMWSQFIFRRISLVRCIFFCFSCCSMC